MGMTVKAHCGSDSNYAHCDSLFYKVRVDKYDSVGNLTLGITGQPCTNTYIGALCGQDSGETDCCINCNAPFGGWPNDTKYRLVINFYDEAISGDRNCNDSSYIDQLLAYLERSSGYWSTIDNPFP